MPETIRTPEQTSQSFEQYEADFNIHVDALLATREGSSDRVAFHRGADFILDEALMTFPEMGWTAPEGYIGSLLVNNIEYHHKDYLRESQAKK